MEKNDDQLVPVAVMVVPLPAQSHLTQLLHLSRKISSYNISVHYVGSTTHVRQIQSRAQSLIQSGSEKIHFHGFTIPSFSSPPPDSKNAFHSHLLQSFEATMHLRQPFAELLSKLSETAKRVVVIHDTLMSFVVQDAALTPNAETYCFHGIAVAALCSFAQDYLGRPLEVVDKDGTRRRIPSFQGRESKEATNFSDNQMQFVNSKAGDIYNTSRAIEAPFIDLLGSLQAPHMKQWAVGPLNPIKVCNKTRSNGTDHLFQWLDKQAPSSVLYIAFGTATPLNDEQNKELALGLEQSKIKFIWVLRDADRADIFTGEARRPQLPEGFEARTQGQGLVIRDWAPQLEILAHKSVGGCLNHGGWGSCVESISMGVPLAILPMHSDHPMTAALVTEHLKVGILVRKWEDKEETVSASTFSHVVRKLIASEEGEELRKRAQELGYAVHESVTEGGVSHKEMDSFIAHITR